MKAQTSWLQVWRQAPRDPSGSRATAEVSRSAALCTQADQKPSTLPKHLAQSCAACSLAITKLQSRHYRRVTERAYGASLPTSRSRNEIEAAAKKRAVSMSMRAPSNATEHSRDVLSELRDLDPLPHGLVLSPSRATNESSNERTSNGDRYTFITSSRHLCQIHETETFTGATCPRTQTRGFPVLTRRRLLTTWRAWYSPASLSRASRSLLVSRAVAAVVIGYPC